MKVDITLLTCDDYLPSSSVNTEKKTICIKEDQMLLDALARRGLSASRVSWSSEYDPSQAKVTVFKTIWDYFDKIDEFKGWLKEMKGRSIFVNPLEVIEWNMDKNYLLDLQNSGVNIVPSYYIKSGDHRSLRDHVELLSWKKMVLKPVVSGGSKHTYVIDREHIADYEKLFAQLIKSEGMMIQEYLTTIETLGEVSHICFNGKYSHSVQKKAPPGDFRVQEQFGGTLHQYQANDREIAFVEHTLSYFDSPLSYARVDVVWDHDGNLALGELELIEPELWFRMDKRSVERYADVLKNIVENL